MAISRNPLRCGGTALPTEVLLMAKLIALALLLTNHVRLMPDPFLPFVPVLEHIAPPAVFQNTLKVLFVTSALALLFNVAVRASAFTLGATILVAILSSKAYYGNNKTFCGLMLLLAGIYVPRWGKALLQAQLALVYFGAGLNKLLDPDWQSGQFFDHWAADGLKNPVFIWARQFFPPLALGKIACWGTAIAELGASVALVFKKLQVIGMWANALFQAGLLLFTGTTFTMFFYAMQSASLVFARWPRDRSLVVFDGDCGFCTAVKTWF